MTFNVKRWAGLSFGTVILGLALAACGSPSDSEISKTAAVQQPHAQHGEKGEGAGHHVDALPRDHRLAFMTGHVEAGLALYRAGEPEMAAPHLLHPVSETHMSERAGLDELGFQAELFEVVSKALEDGTVAEDIEPQLQAAEANLRLVTQKAGGNTAGIINFLMETIVEEYSIAITEGKVTDPGEYQDAYGFSIVASKHAASLRGDEKTALVSKIDELINLWPAVGPIPPSNPTSIEDVVAKISEIQLLLSANQ